MPTLDDVLATIDQRRSASLAQLKEFLSIPSVSAQPDRAGDVRRCAQWLADQFKHAALETSVMATAGHPVVVAKNKHRAGRPTVLLYGHYDVQPPEPLDLWHSPPFEATVRPDAHGFPALFARGAVDDKGQVWCHAEAITCWQAHGGLPVNLTVLIEGEEEVGSENLLPFLREHADALRADVCLVSDTAMFDRATPSITYALRGLVYAEIVLTGANSDLHSGGYGGGVTNPGNALCAIVAALKDERGRVTLPGFYDAVRPLSEIERAMWAKLPFTDADFFARLGVDGGVGEHGYSTLERVWSRPTLDVNGLTCGYQGAGAKTVLPNRASAKVSMRLVSDQDPHAIACSFEAFVRERVPTGLKCEIQFFGEAHPVVAPIDQPATKLAGEAVERAFGKRPAFIRGGGTIPVCAWFKEVLGLDPLLVGFGLPDDNLHAPNEKFDVAQLEAGTRAAAILYERLSKLSEPTR